VLDCQPADLLFFEKGSDISEQTTAET
jgi:DNA-binding Xre family transcriptional regulator